MSFQITAAQSTYSVDSFLFPLRNVLNSLELLRGFSEAEKRDLEEKLQECNRPDLLKKIRMLTENFDPLASIFLEENFKFYALNSHLQRLITQNELCTLLIFKSLLAETYVIPDAIRVLSLTESEDRELVEVTLEGKKQQNLVSTEEFAEIVKEVGKRASLESNLLCCAIDDRELENKLFEALGENNFYLYSYANENGKTVILIPSFTLMEVTIKKVFKENGLLLSPILSRSFGEIDRIEAEKSYIPIPFLNLDESKKKGLIRVQKGFYRTFLASVLSVKERHLLIGAQNLCREEEMNESDSKMKTYLVALEKRFRKFHLMNHRRDSSFYQKFKDSELLFWYHVANELDCVSRIVFGKNRVTEEEVEELISWQKTLFFHPFQEKLFKQLGEGVNLYPVAKEIYRLQKRMLQVRCKELGLKAPIRALKGFSAFKSFLHSYEP